MNLIQHLWQYVNMDAPRCFQFDPAKLEPLQIEEWAKMSKCTAKQPKGVIKAV